MLMDLSRLPTMGKPKLIKMFPKKERESSSMSISWEIDVMTEVNTLEEAKVLNITM